MNRKILKSGLLLALMPFFNNVALWASESVNSASKTLAIEGQGLAIGAGLAIGISALGAGIAIGNVGSSAIGAVVEKPDFMAKALIFVGLGEALAIYGMVISILLWMKL